ncbi:hypothetical protein M9Y10_024340 [Tritrichomonas musculus]|uniref:EGF-like domain-containing protein n=1 Tax=Tritrichomonas musculus TaxID=1915356 RepID=A0ABR2HCQ2_9EUKA
MVVGSPNYLNLSPFRVSSSARKISAPFASHWFLIQVISSIIDISTFGNSKNIYFSSENMVADGWFRMYLNQDQFQFLKDSTHFELYPIEKKLKISPRKVPEKGNYFVHASSDWTSPGNSRIVYRISDTIFYVENLIIDDNVMNDPRILEINPSGTIEMLNRYNTGFLDNGNQISTYNNGIFAPIRSVHNLGINGSGQVINVVDSGVDVFNAFFYDPNNSLDSITSKTNRNHRKVIRIEPYADNTDLVAGHGTHVAGTAAGKAYCDKCGISQYNGIASESKLYFSDIGDSETGQNSGRVDLITQAQIFDELDVHVSSNSWGYSTNEKEIEFSYNKAAYDNPDVLYVFAAGNSGKYNTIYCPGNAKNIATVGSVEKTSSAILEISKVEVFIQNDKTKVAAVDSASLIYKASVDEEMKYYVNLPWTKYESPYLPQDCTEYTVEECHFDERVNATICENVTKKNCSELVPRPDFDGNKYFNGKIAILNTEKVSGPEEDQDFCDKAKYASNFGAVAAICAPSSTYFKCEVDPPIPLIRVSSIDDIKTVLEMGDISLMPYGGDENAQFPKASYQASKGPADSGLFKPDISTPGGMVYSAKGHGPNTEGVVVNASYSSNIRYSSGTSMATPAASALAVLILQYLRDGFYPGLKRGSGPSLTPTSCLLRSILVNTAQKPASLVPESKSQPRSDVGFGVPILDVALGFNGKGFRFIDNETIGTQSHRVYTIKADSNSADLNVTLVYLDPPLDTSNEAIFFADLDLYVKAPNGNVYMGNNISDGESLTLIERVVIDKEDIPENGGEFEIHVISSKYPIESTKILYAIAVNGPFEQSNMEKNPLYLPSKEPADNDCPNNCNGNGSCNKGMCVCKDGFVGPYCSIAVSPIKDGESYDLPYEYGQIKYFKLPLNDPTLGNGVEVSFDIVKSFNLGPVYFCTSFNENPGKIWNAGWECHLACPPPEDAEEDEDYPFFQNYTIKVPVNENPSAMNIALYSSYYEKKNVGLNNIKLKRTAPSKGPTIEPTSSSGDKKKVNSFPLLAIILVSIVAVLVVASIIILIFAVRKKKEYNTAPVSMTLISNA